MCRQHLILNGKKSPWVHDGIMGIKASFRDPTSPSIPLHYQSQFVNSNPLLTTESFQPMCIKRGLKELSLQRIPVQNNAMQTKIFHIFLISIQNRKPQAKVTLYINVLTNLENKASEQPPVLQKPPGLCCTSPPNI